MDFRKAPIIDGEYLSVALPSAMTHGRARHDRPNFSVGKDCDATRNDSR